MFFRLLKRRMHLNGGNGSTVTEEIPKRRQVGWYLKYNQRSWFRACHDFWMGAKRSENALEVAKAGVVSRAPVIGACSAKMLLVAVPSAPDETPSEKAPPKKTSNFMVPTHHIIALTMAFNLEQKLINVLVLFITLLNLTLPHLGGLVDALAIQFAGVVCRHVPLFGGRPMIPQHRVLSSIARYKKSGVGDILAETSAWWCSDGPERPSMISVRSAAKVLLYYVTYTWAVLDLDTFLHAVNFLAWPIFQQTIFWVIFYISSGESTTRVPETIIHWVRSDRSYTVVAYGFGAYALAFRGYFYALGVFFAACWVSAAMWPFLTAAQKSRFMFVIGFPLNSTEYLIKSPYAMIWPWRHLLRMPLWRAQHRYRSWCRRIKQRDQTKGSPVPWAGT